MGWLFLWLQGLEPLQGHGGVPWRAAPLRVHSQSKLSVQPRNSPCSESPMLSQAGREWDQSQGRICVCPAAGAAGATAWWVSSPLSASGPLLLFLSVSNKVQLNLDSVILEVFSSLNGFCDFLILQPLTQNPP